MKKVLPFILIAIATTAIAELVHLTGQTPTAREDDTLLGLSEIKGSNIYCGPGKGDYSYPAVFIAGATLPTTEWDFDLPIGTHYCVVTTLDLDARESVYSNEVTYVVEGKSRPNPWYIPPGTVIRKTVTLP